MKAIEAPFESAPRAVWAAAGLIAVLVGAGTAYAGPGVALGLTLAVLGLFPAVWLFSDPLRPFVLYAFLVPLDVYVSTTLRLTSLQVLQVCIVLAFALREFISAERDVRLTDLPARYRWAGGLLLVFLALSLAWSIDPAASIRTYLRMAGGLSVGALAVLHIRTAAQLRRIVVAVCFGALVTAAYGYPQYFRGSYDSLYRFFSPFYTAPFLARGGGFAVAATFSNPNILAAYGMLALPLTWGLVVESRGVRKLAWALSGGFLAGVIVLTFSKASWIVLSALAALWALAWLPVAPKLLLAGVVGILGGVVLLLLDPILRTLVFLFPDSRAASVDARLGLWYAAAQVFFDRPLVGHGLDGFAAATSRLRTGTIVDLLRAHNMYLQFLVDIGIAGSVLFWATVGMPFRDGLQAMREWTRPSGRALHLGLLLSTLSFFLFNLVDFHNSNQYISGYWLIFGLLAVSSRLSANAAVTDAAMVRA